MDSQTANGSGGIELAVGSAVRDEDPGGRIYGAVRSFLAAPWCPIQHLPSSSEASPHAVPECPEPLSRESFKSFDNGWQFRTDAFSIPARRACSIPGPSRPPIDLLRPFPADEMEAFEVSTDVGNVKNNSPELLNSK
jgi:hypothetical protein